jgi:UTP--glucose-1-phosphate uridylyltransferase
LSNTRVRKAVIPVAGLGTRFLPATKAIPKELLPIVDKPTVQYIVEEAAAAGIEDIIFVNGRNKEAIEDHFDYAPDLEGVLTARGKESDARAIRSIADLAHFVSVRQKEPAGLGHAVLAARRIVGDEPFAVMLGDDLIRTASGAPSGIGQLVQAFDDTGLGQIALMEVHEDDIEKYGAAEGTADPKHSHLVHLNRLVEKPPKGTVSTNLAVIGRYVLPPTIWPLLEKTAPGRGGEIQLTDALAALMQEIGLMGCRFEGLRVDAGDKLGYLEANLLEAWSRDDLRPGLKSILQELLHGEANN